MTTATGPAGELTTAADHPAVRRFIHFDRIGTLAGLPVVIVANGLLYRSAAIWSIALALVLVAGILTMALRALDRGSMVRALTLTFVGNWLIAVYVTLVLPFLWPPLVLVVIMPLVQATPYLTRGTLLRAFAAGAMVATVVSALGLLNDDGGALPDIDDAFEVVVVIGAMLAVIAPIGLSTFQGNDLQRRNLVKAEELNRQLERSRAQLAASRRRVVEAADVERRRIERDLHDGAQQRLVALGVHLRLLDSQGVEDEAVGEAIRAMAGEVDATVGELRELAHGIYPPLLRSQGLAPALTAVARRSPSIIELDLDDVGRFDESAETALYFAALEAMTNSAKHAPDATIRMSLRRIDDRVELTVADDGPGFVVDDDFRTLGTRNMGDRLAAVDGELVIDAAPGRGTTVAARAPFAPSDRGDSS